MKRILIVIIMLFIIITVFLRQSVHAQYTAGSSAAMRKEITAYSAIDVNNFYLKKMALKSLLQINNSPLIGSIDSFLTACQKYDLNCYLLPSIAGVESYFGKYLMPDSYNPFGWGGGYIYFKSWNEGIDTVASGLRNNYLNKGADSVDKIGPIYATSLTWSPKVKSFMAKFTKEEEKFRLYFESNPLKL